jgi:Skp family chaperone for outer membrane proteins
MKTVHKFWIGSVASALLAAVVLGQAAQPARPATHNALAVVDIAKVFGSLNEKLADDSAIDAETKQVNEEKGKREQQLEDLQNQLKNDQLFKQDSPEYQKLQDDAMQKSFELDAYLKAQEQKLLMEQRLKTIQIYRAMNDAIQQFAENNGIGIVLVADGVDFSRATTTEAVQQRIALRKVVYAHPDFDITQKIIEKMNADFRLGSK